MNKLGNVQQVAFVTGGSGFVGGRLIQALVAQGWQVRALVRGQKAAASVATLGAVPVLEELTDQAALSKAMAGSKVVFHVAALFKMWGKQEEFNAVNVDGTRTLVEAALDTPSVQKVIMVSAAGVVQGDPEPQVNIDERLPVQQRSFAPYSASKAAAEQILLAANGRREGFQTVALRPTMIWGTGMPMLDRMVEVVKAGNWQWPDGGTHAMSTCHINNLVDALLLAVERGHGAYFVADAEEVTLRSIVSDLLATRGVKAGDKNPGIDFDDLPPIHAVFLSHSHYDHLDVATLRRLHAVHSPLMVMPLGNDVIVRAAVPWSQMRYRRLVGSLSHPAWHHDDTNTRQ